jgi:hypothetical protein
MYPPERAFLVQFSSDTDSARERMIGRAEHIDSGRRCRFDSWEELERFVKQVMTAQDSGDEKQ